MYYIYLLRDLNNKIQYIGQTQNLNTRKSEHKRNKPPHSFELIEQTEVSEDAKNLEIDYIKKYDTYKNGWNKSTGGEGFDNYDRQGIGGVNKGTIPWNKGIKGCFSEETIEQMKNVRKGKVFSRKLSDDQIKEIRLLYEKSPDLSDVGLIMKNGKKMSYIQSFCKEYSSKYNITPQGMRRIILGECWKNV